MLGEAIQIVKDLWTQERTTFHGRFYDVTDALSEPKPVQRPRIPLWVGGSGEKLTLRVVAESADGWNTFYGPMEAYRHKLDVLAQHCRDVGRDPNDIRKSLVIPMLVAETESEVRNRLGELDAGGGSAAEALQTNGVVGTPEQVIEALLPHLRAGVGDFLLRVRTPYDVRTLELVAREVAPVIKTEGASVGSKR